MAKQATRSAKPVKEEKLVVVMMLFVALLFVFGTWRYNNYKKDLKRRLAAIEQKIEQKSNRMAQNVVSLDVSRVAPRAQVFRQSNTKNDPIPKSIVELTADLQRGKLIPMAVTKSSVNAITADGSTCTLPEQTPYYVYQSQGTTTNAVVLRPCVDDLGRKQHALTISDQDLDHALVNTFKEIGSLKLGGSI